MAVKDRKVETNTALLKKVIILPFPGSWTEATDQTAIATFYNHEIWIVTHVSVTCKAKDNLTFCRVDVKDDGVSLFSTLPDVQSVAAGAEAAGTLDGGDQTIAANSKITVDITVDEADGGGSATDLTVAIYYRTQALGEAS